MKKEWIGQFTIAGASARTNRVRESSGAGVTPCVWAQFQISRPASSDAVYIGYSDWMAGDAGDFTVTVGTRGTQAGSTCIVVAAGAYLAFAADGALCDALDSAWRAARAHLASQHLYGRTYLTDFAECDPSGRVTLFIGIREGR